MIRLELKEGVGVLRLDNPPVNALNRALITELQQTVSTLVSEGECRVLVLTGDGRNFSAGADLREFAHLADERAFECASALAGHCFQSIESTPFPVIAAIDGYCLGGGNELAMACHLRVASTSALFGQPEVRLGLIPGFGGTQRLTRIVGRSHALRLMLSGENIDAREAFRLGLVDQVIDEGTTAGETAIGMAQAMAGYSRRALRHILGVSGLEGDFALGIHQERKAFGECGASADGREGILAFLKKRKPEFKE